MQGVRRLAVLLALVVTACGSSTPPPPAGQATATVKRYFAALSRGDAAAVCRELSPAARKGAASSARTSSCERAMHQAAASLEPEILRNLALARIEPAKVDGGKASVRVTGDDAYATEKRTATVPLEARDGAWVITRLAGPGNGEGDPVTACVTGGFETLEKGKADPYWTREGRAAFAEFMSRYCKRAYEEGVYDENTDDLTAAQNRALDRIGSDVLEQMVRRGIVKRP